MIKNKKGLPRRQAGQTMIILIFFVLTALAVTVIAIFISTATSSSTSDLENGIEVKELAESGAENALLQLERNPSYTGETYTTNGTTITTVVSGSSTKAITATAVNGNFTQKVAVTANYNNNILTVVSWKDTF